MCTDVDYDSRQDLLVVALSLWSGADCDAGQPGFGGEPRRKRAKITLLGFRCSGSWHQTCRISLFHDVTAHNAIFIVMIGGIGLIEGVLIGALIYFFADRWFAEYGATYLVVLGVLTVLVALYARTGVWGMLQKFINAPWFPTRRILLERDKS